MSEVLSRPQVLGSHEHHRVWRPRGLIDRRGCSLDFSPVLMEQREPLFSGAAVPLPEVVKRGLTHVAEHEPLPVPHPKPDSAQLGVKDRIEVKGGERHG